MRKLSCLALGVMFLALGFPVNAQQVKVPRIGYLDNDGSAPPHAFVQGLRDLGYVEGRNIAIEYRSAKGKRDRTTDIAAELVRLRPDIIVADGTVASLAAKKATNTIPIVMTTSTDPVGNRLVASLSRPGGNVTGLSSLSAELGGKFLELLKETLPRLSRVSILMTGGAANRLFVKETEPSARALGVKLTPVVVEGPDDFESAFRAMTKERPDALVSRLPATSFSHHYERVAELAAESRLPTIATSTNWVKAGGLISYGSNVNESYRRTATYVDKILKGTKPADLPVEQPTKFELVINLKTAKQIGVTIPPNVLARADRVIR